VSEELIVPARALATEPGAIGSSVSEELIVPARALATEPGAIGGSA
jgi:hypothetical protein